MKAAIVSSDYERLCTLRRLRGNPAYPPSGQYLKLRSATELEIRQRGLRPAPIAQLLGPPPERSLPAQNLSVRGQKDERGERGMEADTMKHNVRKDPQDEIKHGTASLGRNMSRFGTQLDALDGTLSAFDSNLRGQVSTVTGLGHMLNETVSGHRTQIGHLEAQLGKLNKTIDEIPWLVQDAIRDAIEQRAGNGPASPDLGPRRMHHSAPAMDCINITPLVQHMIAENGKDTGGEGRPGSTVNSAGAEGSDSRNE